MPDLVQVYRDFEGEDIEVYAVCMDLVSETMETADQVEAFARERDIDLPVIVLTGKLEEAQELFDIEALPHTVLYSDGEARHTHVGQASEKEFAEMLRAALGSD